MQLKITPDLTCNNQKIDLNKGIWFEVAEDRGKKEGTITVYKTSNLADALLYYHKTITARPKFIDAWVFPIKDNVPYPIDQFSFERM